METLSLKTDLHCQKCIDEIRPILDADTSIHNWTVDMEGQLKTLNVEGNNVSSQHINKLLQLAGYSILGQKSVESFWSDWIKWKRASFNTLNYHNIPNKKPSNTSVL